ncbi:MAG TPA: L-serine ammonia-lyase, iron-sulfur-dependent, subunit alpha [Coriobacteriia bacterium]|nr:L-serine ammonia-lyase, iron-sulfur-dependent, subunit alpha [Coriobacteriia bacterium]
MAYASFADLLEAARTHGSLGAAALAREADESERTPEALTERMAETLAVMRDAVARGRTSSARSRSGLTGGDANAVANSTAGPVGGLFTQTLASALATAEVNAAMGRIVAAPTGGASGVLPAVILEVASAVGATDAAVIEALFAAGGVGGVIAARATLSGAAGGCQAEVGSGAAMAAAAATQLAGGTPEQAGHAASLAMQGLLGLVCDPVGGLVEVPCVVRNATGAAVALSAVEMALAGVEFPIPFDEVVDAAAHVGRSLPPSLRETAGGGLAATVTAHQLVTKSCS